MVLPGMSDGRCFTSYASACDYNQALMKSNNLSASEYKAYIQHNATDIMKKLTDQQSALASSEKTLCIDLRST